MEPKEGNGEARGRLRQVGQKDSTPEMRWNSCSRPRLGVRPFNTQPLVDVGREWTLF